jgi:hypothetical protein
VANLGTIEHAYSERRVGKGALCAVPTICQRLRNLVGTLRFAAPAYRFVHAELVGWVEPLRNPSHVAIATMGFASTFAVLQFADEIAQPILQTGTASGTPAHGLALSSQSRQVLGDTEHAQVLLNAL